LGGDTNYFSRIVLAENGIAGSLTTSNIDVGGTILITSSYELEDGCLGKVRMVG
jgi:hypothetical protein